MYIGETKRPVHLRFNEYIRHALNVSEGTPMGDHFREQHSATDAASIPFKVQIIHKAKDHPDRKIAESLLIKRNRPALNSNVSSWAYSCNNSCHYPNHILCSVCSVFWLQCVSSMYACLTYCEWAMSVCIALPFVSPFLHTEDFVRPGHEFYKEKKTTG